MYIKRRYNFIIDKERGKLDGKLRLRIKWDSNKSIVAFNLGFRVDPLKWSKESGRCMNNTTHGDRKIPASVINKKIQEYENSADQVFTMFESAGNIPSVDDFRREFSTLIGRVDIATPKKLIDIYDEFVREVGKTNDWTSTTYQRFAVFRKKVEGFDATDFDTFNEEGLNNFVIYMREQYNLRNSTIGRQIGYLRWFLRWAYLKGFNKQVAYQTFAPKLKQAEKRVVFLTWEELMAVYNYEFAEDQWSLAHVRDVFCFCCFTSLRYSDVANLKRSDIYENHIEVTTLKTADNLKIELNDYSREILRRYQNETYHRDLVLPVITNQRMNEYLKVVGELCGIDTPTRVTYYIGNTRHDEIYPKYALLGTHAGRRTFICNALMLGIAPNIVMKWTGHSDYKAMKPYIDIADQAKKDAMSLFNKR